MPRPVNTELKNQMIREAFRGFRTQGYDATSYSYIAEKCSTSKALVNYYFPQKEALLTLFINKLLDETDLAIGRQDDTVSGIAEFFRIGQVFLAFLLQEKYRRFFREVLASREYSSRLLEFNVTWAYGFMDRLSLPDVNTDDVRNTAIMLMGGVYDLLFFQLSNGEAPEAIGLIEFAASNFLKAMDMDADSIARERTRGFVNESQLGAIIAELNESFEGDDCKDC